MLQLKTDALMVTPYDDEEDNMAMLCCHGKNGEMFMLTRYPDEDEVELTWDYEPSTLDEAITLSDTTLQGKLAAGDADALGGKDHLEITHATAASDLAEVEETCKTSSKALAPTPARDASHTKILQVLPKIPVTPLVATPLDALK